MMGGRSNSYRWLGDGTLHLASFFILVTLIPLVTAQCQSSPCHCETNSQGGIVINCRHRDLQTIPKWANSSYSFAELTLANNRIQTVQNRAFEGLRIKKLDLSNNQITTIESEAFAGLENSLEELILHVDSMSSFPVDALSILTKLNAIYLKGFHISKLPPRALGTLTQLQSVSLVKCGLRAMAKDDFQAFKTQLTMLSLAENKLTEIPVAAITDLVNMKELDLTHNQIVVILGGTFAANTKVTQVDLSNNQLTTMSQQAFQGLETSLEKLILQNNLLSGFQLRAVANLTRLRELNTAMNSIMSVPMDTFTNTSQLQLLNLRGNKVSVLSMEALAPTRNSLKELDISENGLRSIPSGVFQGFSSLEKLQMDGQPLWGIVKADIFTGIEDNLQRLSLSMTNFTSSNLNALSGLRALQSLNLKQNNIKLIPDQIFQNMRSLSNLDLSFCGLTNLSQSSLDGLQQNLAYINLNGNNITTLNECVFYEFSRLPYLGLNKNPLQCDCGLLWLRKAIPQMEKTSGVVVWQCTSPSTHQGKMLRDISEAALCPSDPGQTQCESLIVKTTTAPTPDPGGSTAIPSSLVPDLPLLLNVTNISHNAAKVSWTLPDNGDIQGFKVTHHLYESPSDEDALQLDKTARQNWLRGLQPASKYITCVTAVFKVTHQNRNTCSDFITANDPGEVVAAKPNTYVIVGAVLGVVALLILLIILGFLYVRRRNTGDPFFTKQKLSNGGQLSSNSGLPTGIPRIGYNSKRFSRPKGATSTTSTELQNNANKDLEKKLAEFSPEERDHILNMLTNSGGSTMSMISNDSQRYVPDLPPRPQQLEGYLNPQTVQEDYNNPEAHIYDEIPAGQGVYYEIPLSNQNIDPPGAVGGVPFTNSGECYI